MKTLQLADFLNREGLIHKTKDGLILFDYSQTVQFSFDWDETTLAARGIVFEESTGKLVARAYDKFFNYDELRGEAGGKLPVAYRPNFEGEFMALDKLDGSCGITYFYNGEWRMNTRGSFDSDQAVWGKAWMDANIDTSIMNSDWTYIFEIIYPENRIVVDYGDYQGLALTGIRDTQSGQELWYDVIKSEADAMGVRVADLFAFTSMEQLFKERDALTIAREGFVVTYRNGYKFKLKGDDYCNLHRALSNLTPLSFWRAVDWKVGMKVPKEFAERLPEEFRDTVDKLTELTESLLQDRYAKVVELSRTVPEFAPDRDGNKDRYMWLTANISDIGIRNLVLQYVRGKDAEVREAIHRAMRPTGNSYAGIELDPRLQRILEGS